MIVECPGCQGRYDVTGRPPGTRARCRCGTDFALPEPTRSAGQLSCPGCGANVSPTANKCDFCAAVLKVKACPRCFARIFDKARHCNECGAKVDRPAEANADGEARQRGCPRCEPPPGLEARLVGDTLLDECPDCHGVFLDACAVERVVRERRQASAGALAGMVSEAQTQAIKQQTSGKLYIKCPDCDQIMNRVNFGRRSGIIVDVCRYHGTWFDAGELPKIVDFVMKGGLEESERKHIDEMREQARRAQSQARTSGSMPAVSGLGGARYEPSSAGLVGGMLGGIVGALLGDY
jgi:Zn-finger nucleic acid-binding protein